MFLLKEPISRLNGILTTLVHMQMFVSFSMTRTKLMLNMLIKLRTIYQLTGIIGQWPSDNV
ncbi:hypothetical protein [Paenibacillus sp. GYB003]|uniref:hypothetical protein n=1 Tax=Paenibacillus sp. GYB003 TaxID=2994392 RepID=UPI003FA792AC